MIKYYIGFLFGFIFCFVLLLTPSIFIKILKYRILLDKREIKEFKKNLIASKNNLNEIKKVIENGG